MKKNVLLATFAAAALVGCVSAKKEEKPTETPAADAAKPADGAATPDAAKPAEGSCGGDKKGEGSCGASKPKG